MKAIRLHKRGGPQELFYEEAPRPSLRAGDALVRVYASGITFAELTWDETYQTEDGASRLPTIPGHEVSGIVEEVSAGVPLLKAGEAVYGLTSFSRDGTAAELVAVRAEDLAPKPRSLDHEHTAAVPLAALTAWQGLFDHAGLVKGQTVLIHGAAGGVGTYAVQLARWHGARVIATAAARDRSTLQQLGAGEVIDYMADRFEDKAGPVDVVFDSVGGETRRRSWQILRPGGTLVSLTGPIPGHESNGQNARGVFFIVKPSRSQLVGIAQLIDEGKLQVLLSEVLPLEQARKAFEQGTSARKPGKIVLSVAGESGVVAA
ncbi:MAG TPA: NADP-dependent oxidoreductase [Terriglobales bacterium]|nr:NADP-dependent oxidoreductase [Terriglobales bacterium]